MHFLIAVSNQPLGFRGRNYSGCLCVNRIFQYSQPLAENQICQRRSAIADRNAWTSS